MPTKPRVGSYHQEADSAGIWMRGGVQVGWSVQKCSTAFWAKLATMSGGYRQACYSIGHRSGFEAESEIVA
jgi:hypothetical protein